MTSTTIRAHNWETWQSYRNDRGAPPWIKVHRSLLSHPKWAELTDAEKGQIVSMWIVAADNHGTLPNDPRVVRKICQLDEAPDIKRFCELGFFDLSTEPSTKLSTEILSNLVMHFEINNLPKFPPK